MFAALHELASASVRTLLKARIIGARALKTLWRHLKEQGRLLSAHARESKKLFYFATFVNALRVRAVFAPAEFNNRTFEGESFFTKSSVSNLKHVTAKNNSK